jgi:autotransporter strand-loop-strand O-heptosyltransferase
MTIVISPPSTPFSARVAGPASPPGTSVSSAPSSGATVSNAAPVPFSAEGVAPNLAAVPTQAGPHGLRFDFNDGCRVHLPEAEHPWRVRLSDLDTGNVLYETEIKAGRVNSSKRYYVRFRLEIWQKGDPVLSHDFAAADRDVLIRFPVDSLGDPIGWFPYAVKFQKLHGCRLTCSMNGKMIGLLRDSYPDIRFVTEAEVEPDRYYATYTIAVYYQGTRMYDHADGMPSDVRRVGLHRAAGYVLGVDPAEEPPLIVVPNDTRPLAESYVCIAVQSTLQAKFWNNPTGWSEIATFLKESGYRVVCIDLRKVHGKGLVWTHIPAEAEDQTGDQPLLERARWLRHADFFIGLSSGLSWLAWAMRTPVVMISGVTHPSNEFETPYRVINYHACNSCWNDPLAPFDRADFLTCPRHKDTPRQFECSRLITAEQVKRTIRRIPGFGKHPETARLAQNAQNVTTNRLFG